MNEEVLSYQYDQAEEQRLDKFLVEQIPHLSRARLQGLIRDGFVEVDQKPAAKSGQLLEAGQQIVVRIPPPAPTGLLPEDIPLDILFEDEDMLVINKPAGMVVHPSIGHIHGTLVQAALAYNSDIEGIGGEIRPGVVHRLDKDTSGLILLAKNDRTHQWLLDQFRLRLVKKTYLALVDGTPPTPRGRIEAPIGRDSIHRQKMAVVSAEKGRDAITEYEVKERFAHHTLLEARPLTGRTHQIRVHMAFLKCPIVGDEAYGFRHSSIPLSRHFLHAATLQVCPVDQKVPMIFNAPLPEELDRILHALRQK